jgi:hypothetical protein
MGDSCWYQNSAVPYAGGGLSGGGWFVGYYNYFASTMDYDHVGITADVVNYYNGYNGGMNMVPCSISRPQNMALFTSQGSSTYFSDTLVASIQQ